MTIFDVEIEDEYDLLDQEKSVFNTHEKAKEQLKRPKRKLFGSIGNMVPALIFLVMAGIAALVAIVTLPGNETIEQEVLAEKAEAVLTARFIDNDVDDLVSLDVQVKGDYLIATWTTGNGANQKTCTAPVQASKDGKLFGIEPIKQLSFSRQETAVSYCIQTAGLKYGLPLGS